LTNSGFRLPGEAQQIDRVMTTFSQCYWEDNAGDYYRCPFDDQDTVFLLSFAIIMLNTDLHKQSLPSKYRSRKQRKRMTKMEFLNNLRDVARDDALSQEYLSSIYDSVEACPIVLFEESKMPVLEITTSTGISNVATEYGNLGQSLKSIVKNVKKSEELLRGLSVHEFRFYTIEDYAEYMSCSKMEASHGPFKQCFCMCLESLSWPD
jgi:Sec7-like guanine-nucleotide exchange factor